MEQIVTWIDRKGFTMLPRLAAQTLMEEQRNLRVVYGSCPHDCPDCCALETRVDEQGRAVSVRGRADHTVTRGWLCAKVNRYLDRVYHPDRLLYPMRRVGPKGGSAFERISWDEAVAEITGRWRDIIAQYGAQCILPYSYAGTLGWSTGPFAIRVSGTDWERHGLYAPSVATRRK